MDQNNGWDNRRNEKVHKSNTIKTATTKVFVIAGATKEQPAAVTLISFVRGDGIPFGYYLLSSTLVFLVRLSRARRSVNALPSQY